MQNSPLQRKPTLSQQPGAGWSKVGKIFLIPLVCTLVTPAYAQSASFRSVDTNSDRVLSWAELVVAFGENGAARLLVQSDHNRDGQLTISELRQGNREETKSKSGNLGEDQDDRGDDDDDQDDTDNDGDDGDRNGDD